MLIPYQYNPIDFDKQDTVEKIKRCRIMCQNFDHDSDDADSHFLNLLYSNKLESIFSFNYFRLLMTDNEHEFEEQIGFILFDNNSSERDDSSERDESERDESERDDSSERDEPVRNSLFD